MPQRRPTLHCPLLVSSCGHVVAAMLLLWSMEQLPEAMVPSALQTTAAALPVYELPESKPQLEPVASAKPVVAPDLVIAKKATPPEKPPIKKAPHDKAVNKQVQAKQMPHPRPIEQPHVMADPFATSSAKQQPATRVAQKGEGTRGDGMTNGYSQLIAQAIRQQLRGDLDSLPEKGTLLALKVDPNSGRVLSAQVAKSSGNLVWDNRSQAAARQTQIPPNPAGPRPQQFTVYVHP